MSGSNSRSARPTCPPSRKARPVSITARAFAEKADGKVVFISPLVDKDSRSARVVAEIRQRRRHMAAGFVRHCGDAIGEQPVSLAVPTNAIQTISNEKVVFVRTAEGFEKRRDHAAAATIAPTEVVTGLKSGDTIAVTNTFLLKAELLKASAED